jgi:tRNA (adenine22-N1)-methyltransferase
VAQEITASCHVDIGSDHAQLARFLLESARAKYVIAIEKHQAPFLNSKQALVGYAASVRLGDGLAVLSSGEADSLSMSGLGALQMLKILRAFPERLTNKLVLQANDKPEYLRAWALTAGFELYSEQMIAGFWPYVVLSFKRSDTPATRYQGLEKDLSIKFGPILLKQKHPLLLVTLSQQAKHFAKRLAKQPHPELWQRYCLVKKALSYYG